MVGLNLTLMGAEVLGPEGLAPRPVSMAKGVITQDQGPRCIDLSGYIVLPGLVDFHGDGFERHVAPRRGAVVDPREGIRPIEAELAANGITTAMLAQFYSWEGGMRGPDFAAAMARALQDAQGLICDLRLQLRVEMNMVDHYAAILDLVRDHQIACVVFNDHLPHEALAAGKRPPRLTGQALKAGRSPEAHLAFLHSLHDRKPEVMPALRDLAGQLSELGVVMGSHDDASPAADAQFSEIGVSLAEFPETVEAAEAARAEGHGVVMGAPNVLRGGSHAGKVSARLLVEADLVDALASDYHYPALLRAALTLWQRGMGLTEAWALVSSGPARLLGLEDRGVIATGKRADFVILDAKSHAVVATIAGGQIAYARGDIVQRLLS